MRAFALAVFFALSVIPASAMGLCGSGPRSNCVVDGDTFWWRGEKIRIVELDAPEIGEPACAAELEIGLRSRDELLSLINVGTVRFERFGLDVYGRTLASITVNGQDVAHTMIEAGVAQALR